MHLQSLPALVPSPSYALGDVVALSLDVGRPLRASCDDEREIYMLDGEVIHARHHAKEGADAVFALLDDSRLRFRVELDRLAPRRSVILSWARLCHEARCALMER